MTRELQLLIASMTGVAQPSKTKIQLTEDDGNRDITVLKDLDETTRARLHRFGMIRQLDDTAPLCDHLIWLIGTNLLNIIEQEKLNEHEKKVIALADYVQQQIHNKREQEGKH